METFMADIADSSVVAVDFFVMHSWINLHRRLFHVRVIAHKLDGGAKNIFSFGFLKSKSDLFDGKVFKFFFCHRAKIFVRWPLKYFVLRAPRSCIWSSSHSSLNSIRKGISRLPIVVGSKIFDVVCKSFFLLSMTFAYSKLLSNV